MDTLHFEIILANICMTQLIVPLAQEIEDAHPGRGIWAFCAACKAAGLKHLGGRLKQHALLKKKIVTDGCEISSDVVSEAAPRTTKIVNFFVSKYVPKWKVEDLRSALIKLKPELINYKGTSEQAWKARLGQGSADQRIDIPVVSASCRRSYSSLDSTSRTI